MKKWIALLMAIVMALSLFAGCGKSEEVADAPEATEGAQTSTEAPEKAPEEVVEEIPEEEGVLNRKWISLNSTKTGFRNPIGFSHMENQLIWESLLKYDTEAGEYICTLADSYEYTPDGLKWTVVLKDATFHDGEPITAEDVVWTYNFVVLAAGSDSGKMSLLKGYDAVKNGEAEAMTGVYAVDEKTVVFEFDAPNFDFEAVLASSNQSILPSHILGEMTWSEATEDEAYWAKPVGSGPYKVVEANFPNYCVLERFDDYVLGQPGVKTIVCTAYADAAAQVAAVMSGDCDIYREIGAADAETVLAANTGVELTVLDSNFIRYFAFNASDAGREDLKNPKIRQALNMIIDKQMIVDYVGATAAVATTLSSGDQFNSDIPVWERNVEAAVQILKDEGFDFNTPLNLYAYYTDQETIDIMDITVANLAEAGVQAEYYIDNSNVGAVLYQDVAFDLAYCGGGSSGISTYKGVVSDAGYDVWYTADAIASRNERYNALLDKYAATSDATVRQQILDEIQINFMEDMHVIPVYFRKTGWLVNTDHLKGFAPFSVDYATTAYLNVIDWELVG